MSVANNDVETVKHLTDMYYQLTFIFVLLAELVIEVIRIRHDT